jgi:hypothetical protein
VWEDPSFFHSDQRAKLQFLAPFQSLSLNLESSVDHFIKSIHNQIYQRVLEPEITPCAKIYRFFACASLGKPLNLDPRGG